MTSAKIMLEIYDLGRDCGMTHQEALGHALRLVDLVDINEDAVYTSAYIAIREDYSAQIARDCAENYSDGLKALAEQG